MKKIAVIGLGYVGLPLAVEFGKTRPVTGFDIDESRINMLRNGVDNTLEISKEELVSSTNLKLTNDVFHIKDAKIYIVTVPTPIDQYKQPDLQPLLSASEIIGGVLKRGDIVIYESTVYPGATEEDCVPVLENFSGLRYNVDFFVGYSPERINPGDKLHRLPSIKKITSGSTPEVALEVDRLYASIISAGTYLAESIKVAEAAKIIENTQRDVNIALINELALIFNKMDIDTDSVLRAAGTKWNFLPFRPGLVGGHCIGVDPYYLTHKAESIGYHPQIILSGRRINDGMGTYVAQQLIKSLIKQQMSISGARVLILGMTFKEDCPDLRNTRVVDVIKELVEYGIEVDVYDPMIEDFGFLSKHELDCQLISEPESASYDGIILAVPHTIFCNEGAAQLRRFGKDKHIFFDLKSVFDRNDSDLRL